MSIKKIGVIGAGTMGHGIAELFAAWGYEVNLFEPYDKVRESVKQVMVDELKFMAKEGVLSQEQAISAIDRITLFSELKPAVEECDFIIEAIPEDLDLKQKLLKELDGFAKKDAIFATNTSSLSLSEMIKYLPEERKSKCMVCHWYNPPHLMPLIELSDFGNGKEEDLRQVEGLLESIGKVTIRVKKDIPGLIANRIQQGVAREVFSLIQMEAASEEDIDKALKFGPAFRYVTTGQLEVADIGGLDIWCIVGDNLLAVMDHSQKANDLLRDLVKQGKVGMKSGEGFFDYSKENPVAIKEEFYKRLIRQSKASEHYK